MKILIVGNGVAGSSLARVARERHHDVTVVNEGTPDSLVAAAILRSGYHRKHPEELEWFHRSLAAYARWGVPLVQGGKVSNYRTPQKPPRDDDDWYLLDPAAPLVPADITGRAEKVDGKTLVNGREVPADLTLWCVGARNGVGGTTYGVTWLHRDPAVLAEPGALRLHHFAPYKTIAAGVAGEFVRLGSSSANNLDKAREQGRRMLHTAHEVGVVRSLDGWEAIEGKRCKAPEMVRELPAGDVGMSGLHRTGYALAPALAEDTLSNLGL